MKQILQNLKDGSTELAEVPCPWVGSGSLLIRTSRSLVSAGTERRLVDFGKANLLDKARLLPGPVLVPFVNDVRLIVQPGMTGATGSCGLEPSTSRRRWPPRGAS